MKQLNLMHTPYEILQLKQKQKRKVISELKKQLSFSIKFNKNGANATQYCMQKEKPLTQHRYRRTITQNKEQTICSNSQKKYQIVFRESIRKVNAYRTKVYHTHAALKKQKFVNRFMATPKQGESPRYHDFINNHSTIYSNRTPTQKAKTLNPEKQHEALSVGKYRIFFMASPQKANQNQIIPQISVEKCKLNPTDTEYKQKIQKTIQSLYDHNHKMKLLMRKCSIDSFTERDNFSSQTQRKNSIFCCNDNIEPAKFTLKSPRSTAQIKRQIKVLKQGETSINMFQSNFETIDQTKVANFIKSKKKKRLPISTIKTSKANNNEYSQFKRTITDNLSHQFHKQNILKNTHERYFSPNKNTRCGARIKFNSIEQNISGWQFQPVQTSQLNHLTKSPLLQY